MFGWLASAFCAAPPFRGKQRLFDLVFTLLPYKFARSKYGVRMKRNARDRTYQLCMLGSYGRFIERLIAERKDQFVFLDIGANQGVFSLLAAKNPVCRRVVALEPNPQTFSFLVQNIAANGFRDRITTFCAAVALEGRDILSFSSVSNHSGLANLFGKGAFDFSAIRIGGLALRTIFDEFGDLPILAKIDVEGAERAVLEALSRVSLLTRIDDVVVEVSNITGEEGGAASLLSFLRENDWREVSRSGHADHFDALFHRQATVRLKSDGVAAL